MALVGMALSAVPASVPARLVEAPVRVPADTALVLRGGKYLDVRAGLLRPNGAIIVRGGTIEAMHQPGTAWRTPADARVVPLESRTILPGLVDAHVHLTIAGDPETNAAATLRAGFTTVIDLGSANGAGLRLRNEIAEGRVLGPTVISAGSWIGAKGGVCEFGGATVSSDATARSRARADLDAGADLLKVCLTGWPAEAIAFPDSVQLKADLLQPVVEAGAAAGRPLYAHAIGREGALLAAATGVRALAHTPIVDSPDAARLKAASIYVISTLATLTAGAEAERVRRSFQSLHEAGVSMVFGTDAGVLPHGANAREFLVLTGAGLSPLEALRSATLNAAALIGSRSVGEIAVGKAGDFVVVEGDPLQDVRVLQRPVLVVRGGRIAGD
jgi:imidazolonepropionase-like amidohydrolase